MRRLLEKWRLDQVSGLRIPGKYAGIRCISLGPGGIAEIAGPLIKLGPAHFVHQRLDVLPLGQNIVQEYRLALGVYCQRFAFRIEIDAARHSVGDNKRRSGKVVCLNKLMNAAGKIAIA